MTESDWQRRYNESVQREADSLDSENLPAEPPGQTSPLRLLVGSLALSVLVGLFTVLNGAGIEVVRGLLATVIAFPAMLVCVAFVRRNDLVGSVVGLAIMCAVVTILPMSVSGRVPQRGGNGDPAPSLLAQGLWAVAVAGTGGLVGWGSYEYQQRKTNRRRPR